MGLFSKSKGDNARADSPNTSSIEHGEKTNVGNTYVPQGVQDNTVEYDEQHLVCPATTTDKKLLARIDFHVIPFLVILYLLAFLDRVNIANAKLFNLTTDLHMDNPNQYNTALVIFFVPYILFEIPSNVLLKKLSPRIWLSSCMFMFGLVSICQGLVTSYGGLLTTRFFLGVFEAGMFPGCFYLIGMWYKRSEAQKRYSFFFSSTTLAGAFGGLIAYGVGSMNGIRGYNAWRWIFILEGVLTCVVALIFFFCIPSFPEHAKWLTEEERAYVRARLRADQGNSAAERKITIRDVGRCFKDYKLYLGGLMYFCLIIPAYGYAYFAPTIISTFGYTAVTTQLYSVAPWAAAFGFAMIIAFVSDRLQHRFLLAIFPMCVAIAGFAIETTVHDRYNLEYAALFLITMGTYSAMPVVVCWFNMNLGGHHRRAVGSAWQVSFGNIGGIIATYAFQNTNPKEYFHTGYSVSLAFISLGTATCCVYAAAITWENRKRDRTPVNTSLTEYEKTEMGDLSPDYRYLL